MNNNFTICINIDDEAIYEFLGKMDEEKMVESANTIERLLIQKGAKVDKVQNVFELFVETVQNMLNYASNSVLLQNNKREVVCNFSLSYFTQNNTYILESCNLIHASQRQEIESRIEALRHLDDKELRQLIRKKSRNKQDSHDHGAGLGYIIMMRKSSSPIEISFEPHETDVLRYKQRLTI